MMPSPKTRALCNTETGRQAKHSSKDGDTTAHVRINTEEAEFENKLIVHIF